MHIDLALKISISRAIARFFSLQGGLICKFLYFSLYFSLYIWLYTQILFYFSEFNPLFFCLAKSWGFASNLSKFFLRGFLSENFER